MAPRAVGDDGLAGGAAVQRPGGPGVEVAGPVVARSSGDVAAVADQPPRPTVCDRGSSNRLLRPVPRPGDVGAADRCSERRAGAAALAWKSPSGIVADARRPGAGWTVPL